MPPGRSQEEQISAVTDTLLARYGIARADIRTVHRRPPDRRFDRVEQHIPVSSGFTSLAFNRDLNARLASLGARVFAVERPKGSGVTMHLVKGGVTFRSIVFFVRTGR